MFKCFNNTCRRYYSHSSGSVNTQPLGTIIKPSSRKVLDAALRVDQAGEVAANWIYRGQMDVFGHNQPFSRTVQVYSALYALFPSFTDSLGYVGSRKRTFENNECDASKTSH